MALRLDAICNDAVFYIELARHYELGDSAGGLGRLGLNVYPPVLAVLHLVGLGWEDAGKWWGVLVSSLAVLPLFGWVRRQFNERTAIVAALLYAFHPKLIEWSPELLRDPTFWFLWTLGLYATWRAVAARNVRWYLFAGLAIALAAHTRFEGWLLYLPLIAWSACPSQNAAERRTEFSRERQPAVGVCGHSVSRGAATEVEVISTAAVRLSRRAWPKAALGVVLCFAVSPAFVLLANMTLLRDRPSWELGNFERLGYVAQWWHATRHESAAQASPMSTAPVADLPPPPPVPAKMSVSKMCRLYGNALRRGFGALFGMLWIVGFVVSWKRLLRVDYAILFVVAACIAAAAWIHLWYGQGTSSRYFLAIVILACPCSATGVLWIYGRLIDIWQRLLCSMPTRTAVTTCVLLAMIAGGLAELLIDHHDGRSREAALGHWLLAKFGPECQIATFGPMPIVAYYARGSASVVSAGDAERGEFAANADIEAFVAMKRRDQEESIESITDRLYKRGYRRVSTGCLPASYDWSDLVLLTKCPPPEARIKLATGERRSP